MGYLKKSTGHPWPTDLTIIYRFIQKQTAVSPVNLLCDVVGVSHSAYYSYVAD